MPHYVQVVKPTPGLVRGVIYEIMNRTTFWGQPMLVVRAVDKSVPPGGEFWAWRFAPAMPPVRQ